MLQMDWKQGLLREDSHVTESTKTISQLTEVFGDAEALRTMDPTTIVYCVQAWCPQPQGTEGGLFWGTTTLEAGRVGSEYFITHGHFHAKRDRTEYYGTIQGCGALILMDESRRTWMEPMSAGSLHFVPPRTAHRVANTGNEPLRFVACWPSDAGYDYAAIREQGFSARLLDVAGEAKLVASNR